MSSFIISRTADWYISMSSQTEVTGGFISIGSSRSPSDRFFVRLIRFKQEFRMLRGLDLISFAFSKVHMFLGVASHVVVDLVKSEVLDSLAVIS